MSTGKWRYRNRSLYAIEAHQINCMTQIADI